MRTLPEGIVTFLFTDVEWSTRLAKEFRDARWADLLDAHRRILRRAFSAHAGPEVNTQSDVFFVVFTRATDAVAAAIEGQQAVEEHPWPWTCRSTAGASATSSTASALATRCRTRPTRAAPTAAIPSG